MKQLKPVQFVNHPRVSPMAGVVLMTKAPKEQLVKRSYQKLVTSHGVSPDKAKELLGI